jgi:uncharacterized protein YwlG (UPF0340 family)
LVYYGLHVSALSAETVHVKAFEGHATQVFASPILEKPVAQVNADAEVQDTALAIHLVHVVVPQYPVKHADAVEAVTVHSEAPVAVHFVQVVPYPIFE